MAGALFETHVFLEILKLAAARSARSAVSHYRAIYRMSWSWGV